MKTREEMRNDEALQNPIFLFQVSYLEFDQSSFETGHFVKDDYYDAGGIFVPEKLQKEKSEFKDSEDYYDYLSEYEMSNSELVDYELATKHWRTQNVFLTREEGIIYGESRPYAWGKFGEGWRVYSVPASGELIQVLDQYFKEKEDKNKVK